eukprot:3025567-Pleurochrysis_carterae.AAC.1
MLPLGAVGHCCAPVHDTESSRRVRHSPVAHAIRVIVHRLRPEGESELDLEYRSCTTRLDARRAAHRLVPPPCMD